MRYRVANLGDVPGFECNGDVCRRIVKPGPGYVAPARTVSRKEAPGLANILSTVIENNPNCFEGEDLSVAYALQQKLQDAGSTSPFAETSSAALMINLSDEEARVAGRAETCNQTPVVQTAVAPGAQTNQSIPATGPLPPGTRLPAAPSSFPIIPVAIGAGALGLIALIVSAVK